ncbi:AI-2E family transporter [Streptomyces capoamus]|uniref:AI-2E family transporter n=1 Tax=Streptomyces capoamus TaxID=68183 RepID=A0A919C319_9ACTN|nr:AI-2E family transporter [Streptomyces capoamus]GGW09221.1 AI-2E family transporter [Streptomyces libani subsp. rufus]GHG44795.1 AI-2E family transporter [Streptomyces capoamus]
MASRPVPVRTILATIGLVLATFVLLELVVHARRVLIWAVIALLLAVSLHPAVEALRRRVSRCRRSVATLLVFLAAAVAVGAVVAVFVIPLAQEGSRLAGRLPGLIRDAQAGRGPVGHVLERTHALRYVQRHQAQIRAFATGLSTPALKFVRGVATTATGALTVFVLAYLMVLEGPKAIDRSLALVDAASAARIRRVGAACARTVNGYLTGNLLISLICGLLTYVLLLVSGVPFAGLLALFVAVTDLIPLVGATIGAVVASAVAFVHSLPAGIGAVVFFIVYQQAENHLLQPLVLSRTVRLNPLTVLLAILIATDVAGILGALLAIPVTGIIQVVLGDLWAHRRGRPLRLPMSEANGPENAEGTGGAE